MMQAVFVTSNEYKFRHAQHMVAPYDIQLEHRQLDLIELQSDSGEEITRYKARQAFAEFGIPVVVNDDTWSIPGLNGFPGAYMKSMNDWLTSEDWLRLTAPLQDRRIILQQHIVYQDKNGQQYFVQDIEGILLNEVRGSHKFGHLSIMSFGDPSVSQAEKVANEIPAIDIDTATAWRLFAEWHSKQND